MIEKLQRWLSGRQKKKETAEFVQKFVEYNVNALEFEPRHLPHNEGKQVFQPQIPPKPNPTSWIGADPSLPSTQEWPSLDGVPAIFLAQISLGDLPENVWGGIGPNEGSLAFFWHPPEYRSVVVLHVTGQTERRKYPDDAPLEHVVGGDARHHIEISGSDVNLPAPYCWPLEKVGQADPVDYDMRLNTVIHKSGLSLPQFKVNSVDRALMMVQAARAQYDRGIERFTGPNSPDELSDSQKKTKKRLIDSIEEFDKLATEVVNTTDFSEIVVKIDDIVAGKVGGVDFSGAMFMERYWESKYKHAVELASRTLYLKDSNSLSEEVRSSLEPVWRGQASMEQITIGGDVSKGYTYTVTEEPVLLLNLLPSTLANCAVGGGQVMGVFMTPDDLKNRRWKRVWGDVVN